MSSGMNYTSAALSTASGKLKSFWQKPEGKLGAFVLGGLGLVASYGILTRLNDVLLLLGNIMANTIELVLLGAGLVAMLIVLTNKTFQTIVSNIFQSLMRACASIYTQVDPIGILKNELDGSESDKAELDKAVEKFSGSDERLKDSISQRADEIKALNYQAQKADQMAATERDPLRKERLVLDAQTKRDRMGLLMQMVKQQVDMEKSTNEMLMNFRHWSQIADSKIERIKMRVELFSDQRKIVLDAARTLSVGQRLLRGKPEQLKLVDLAIEQLQDEALTTRGQIREFNRYSDKLLTSLDIENAANADAAAAQMGEFSQRLLTAAQTPAAVDSLAPVQGEVVSKAPIPDLVGGDDYSGILKK